MSRACGVSQNGVQPALLFRRSHNHDFLIDAIDNHRFGLKIDEHRFCQKLLGEAPDLSRHRGGKHGRAALVRDHARDLLDVADEAHVEHAVGFVENERLHARKIAAAHVDVIEQAAGRGNEDVHAAL